MYLLVTVFFFFRIMICLSPPNLVTRAALLTKPFSSYAYDKFEWIGIYVQ